MATTIDVSIRGVTMVLPVFESSTVASISEAAIHEYRSFHLKNNPQKVLYTKDARGRVLSGALQISVVAGSPSSNEALQVIVEDYSQQDSASPSDVMKLYRDWQMWAAMQMKEHIQYLSYREVPILPESTVLQLLDELGKSPGEDVQLSCLSSCRLLLSKFPQKHIVIMAAEQISKMFCVAKSPKVALYALESFKDLSPLQMKLFDSSKCVRNMIDVQHHLTRFPMVDRGDLFQAFEYIIALIEDEDLLRHFQQINAHKEDAKEEENSVSDEVARKVTFGDEGNLNLSLKNKSNSKKRWNVARLLSLLSSEDTKLKHYALEKIKKALTTAVTWHQSGRQREGQKLIGSRNLQAQIGSNSVMQHSAASTGTAETSGSSIIPEEGVVSGEAKRQSSPLSPIPDNNIQTSGESMGPLVIKDDDEFQALVVALALCLKTSIRGRQQQQSSSSSSAPASNLSGLSTAARLITSTLAAKDTDLVAVRHAIDCLFLLAFDADDILVIDNHSFDAAFMVPVMRNKGGKRQGGTRKQPRPSSQYVNPLTGTVLGPLQRRFLYHAREHYRLLFTLAHTAESLSSNHAATAVDTSSSPQNIRSVDPLILEDIAEKAAALFALVTLHGPTAAISAGDTPAMNAAAVAMSGAGGWATSALHPEVLALTAFLYLPAPCYRLYIGLTYLSYLAHNSNVSSTETVVPTSSSSVQNQGIVRRRERLSIDETNGTIVNKVIRTSSDDINIEVNSKRPPIPSAQINSSSTKCNSRLEALLAHDQRRLLRRLWWWCVADARVQSASSTSSVSSSASGDTPAMVSTNFLVRRLAWRVLSAATSAVTIADYLWQAQRATVDVVPVVLTLLCRAYRPRGVPLAHREDRRHRSFLAIEDRTGHLLSVGRDGIGSDALLSQILGDIRQEDDGNDDYLDTLLSDDNNSAEDDGGSESDGADDSSSEDASQSSYDHNSRIKKDRKSRVQKRKIKVDVRLVRALLKTLSNLLLATATVAMYFPPRHRKKLVHYLLHLQIGPEDDAAGNSNVVHKAGRDRRDSLGSQYSGSAWSDDTTSDNGNDSEEENYESEGRRPSRPNSVALVDVADRDKVVGAYLQMILDAAKAA